MIDPDVYEDAYGRRGCNPVDCMSCGGSGVEYGETCITCGGEGFLIEEGKNITKKKIVRKYYKL